MWSTRLLTVGAMVALCCLLVFTSNARRNLVAWKWGGRSGARYVVRRSSPAGPDSSTKLRSWSIAGALVLAGAVATWIAGAWVVAVFVALIGLCLLGMAADGLRTNRALAPPTTDPVADVVDRQLLRFSPRVDDLIREICELGGRDQLRGFDWGDPNDPRGDLDGLYARLKVLRDSLTIFR